MEETKVKVSIKTRLGVEDPEEVQILTEIFNQYEFQEWILHSRVREDFYKNTPHMDAFQYAYTHSKNHICYNGDIFTLQDYDEIREAYPQLEGVMIGRGLIANPGLVGEIYGDGQMKKEVLYHFLCDLQHRYAEVLSGDRDVLFRLKEIWAYMQTMFDAPNKDWKKMRKAQNLDAYQKAMDHLFETCELLTGAGFPGTK